MDDPYDMLMEYRHSDLDTLLTTRYANITVDECLLKDQLVAKFFVPYSIVVSSKKFMIEICCLDGSAPILRKNTGKYCPHYDKWPLARPTRT